LLRVARSLTVIRQEMSEGPTKTHQVRRIAIDHVTGAFLLVRRQHQERYADQVGVPLCADPYVLSRSADGSGPCLPDGLSHGYERLAKRLGIGGHLHELRHFAATTGGTSERRAARTVLRATPLRRVTSLVDSPSALCSRRISAQSSTSNNSFLLARP
jgi:hypothetical protein